MGAARLSMALCLKLESSVSTSAMWRLFSCIWPSPVNSTATALTLGLCKAKPEEGARKDFTSPANQLGCTDVPGLSVT